MKTLGYVFGGMLLLDGLWGLLSPRSGFSIYRDYFKPYMPAAMNKLTNDYARLSDPAIRYLSAWTAITGLFILLMSGYAKAGGESAES